MKNTTIMQSIPIRCVALLPFALAFILTLLPAAAQEETAVPQSRLAEILAGDTPETVDELRALQWHVQQIAERVLPAVVSIVDSTTASGVLVRRDDSSYVLSAGHVTRSAGRELALRTDDLYLQGVTLGANLRSDVGLIQVETKVEHTTVEIGTSTDLKVGQWVMTLGHPSGRKPGRSAPVRLARFLGVSKLGYLMTDSTGQMGDSGGPLFDMGGRVIGIHSHGTQSLAVSMQAPIDTLIEEWTELKEGKVTQISRMDGWAISLASRVAQGSSLSQGDTMRGLWAEVVEPVNSSVIQVFVGDEQRALGTVVAPDMVITKYSELSVDDRNANRTCRQSENSWTYSIVGYDEPADLALLRIDGGRLPPITWHSETPSVGSLLASPDGDAEPIGIGVMSTAPYRRTPPYAVLGVWFKTWGEEPAEIQEAFGAAQAAGLRGGDVLVQFGKERVESSQQLLGLISQRRPGDKVIIVVKRDDADLKLAVTLGANRKPIQPGESYRHYWGPMDPPKGHYWGPLSEVRSGFETILQHDTVLKPEHCGGPLIDLEGRVIGLNIARAGATETLALPASEVQRVVASLVTASPANAQPDTSSESERVDAFRKELQDASKADSTQSKERPATRVSRHLDEPTDYINNSDFRKTHVISLGCGGDSLSSLYYFPLAKHYHLVDLFQWGSDPEQMVTEIIARLKSVHPDATVEVTKQGFLIYCQENPHLYREEAARTRASLQDSEVAKELEANPTKRTLYARENISAEIMAKPEVFCDRVEIRVEWKSASLGAMKKTFYLYGADYNDAAYNDYILSGIPDGDRVGAIVKEMAYSPKKEELSKYMDRLMIGGLFITDHGFSKEDGMPIDQCWETMNELVKNGTFKASKLDYHGPKILSGYPSPNRFEFYSYQKR